MMLNSSLGGAVPDSTDKDRDKPTGRKGDRSGKVGDSVDRRNFTIYPETAVIEISGGRVTLKVEKSTT